MIKAMRDLTAGVFEHLWIMLSLDLDLSIKYNERILKNSALNKSRRVLWVFKDTARGLNGKH